MNAEQFEKILALRAALHACPELSGRETRTLDTLFAFLKENTSLRLERRDGWLLAGHVEGGGLPSLAFRADVDAIPVEGQPDAARHGCGHDGHSAALCALALALEGRRVGRNLWLVFQPAEETGEGAKRICSEWRELAGIDRVYALHNIPGYPLGAVLVRRGCFACASCGLVVDVLGRPAHAAYPGEGANPVPLLSHLALAMPGLIENVLGGADRLLMHTLIGLRAGGENFGVSASEGRLCMTLRGHDQRDIHALIAAVKAFVEDGCAREGMTCAFALRDPFPDTTSDDAVVDDALARFRAAGLPAALLPEPMRWSEDFGWFLRARPGMYFGIGAGENCPGLHTAGYAFDDAVLPHALAALSVLAGLV